MLAIHPNNPFRSVNWRWERARAMRERKVRGVGKEKSDPWTYGAYKFQLALAQCKDEVDHWNLMEEFPEIYSAYLVHKKGDETERHPMRFALEARLLAGQSTIEIADMIGVTPATITWYERVFFNIIDKLKNKDYIITCVIGPSIHAGLTDRDYDLLWKLYGFLYGPAVLDSFIQTTSRDFRPENIAQVDAALAEDARSNLQRKVAIVARTFIVNPFSQTELLNVYARMLELEKDTGKNASHDVILQNVQIMLDKLPWQTGSRQISTNDEMRRLDKLGVEMNATELLAAAIGDDVGAMNEVEELKFPEQQNVNPTK